MTSPRGRRPRARVTQWTQQYVFGLGAVVLTVFVLHEAKSVILPLALAVLVAFVATPVVSLIQSVGVRRVPAVLLTLLLSLAVVTGVSLIVSVQLTGLLRDLPNHQQEIEVKIARIRGSGGAVARVAAMVDDIYRGSAAKQSGSHSVEPVQTVRVEEGSPLGRAMEPALHVLEPIATAGLVVVLMVFMLIGREDLRSRMMATLGRGRLVSTVRVLEESSRRTGRFLLLQLAMNAGLGALFGAGLALLDVPYAPLWGFLTAVLRFIPYVGTWVSLLLPLSLSFATTPGWQQPLMILSVFLVLDLVVANVVEPVLFGHHTGVSPIALLVAAAFWAWVWGPIGLLVSTPLTVCLVVLGQHVPHLSALALLLGDRPGLPPHLDYFQRVLAGGHAAGLPVVLAASAATSAAQAFDDTLIPALALTRADRATGTLTAEDERRIQDATRSAIPPVLAAAPTAVHAQHRLVVLGTPAHLELEEVPLVMLAGIMEREGHEVTVLSTRLLPADVVRRVGEVGAHAVVISILPPGGLQQAAHLCELLRARYPELLVIAARWGRKSNYDRLLVRFRRRGASYLTTSLVQTYAQVRTARASRTDEAGEAASRTDSDALRSTTSAGA